MGLSRSFAYSLPKAELHLHIEGTLEPELMFKLAKRNKIKLPYASIGALKKAYHFGNLQDFLDLYYAGCAVLVTERDFSDMAFAYFQKAHSQGVRHAELFFDPQTHTKRGIPFKTVVLGITSACARAKKQFGITSRLIMCFLRHLSEQEALDTLKQSLGFKKHIYAVGIDSSEKGNPPSKFTRVFARARKLGFKTVAHAGEEGPASYVQEALSLLKVERIDHGNHSLDDEKLVAYLAKNKVPLTVCPLSNLKLRVVKHLKSHPLKTMLDKGLFVTVNSDDPAYFGGYVGDNYYQIAQALGLSKEDLVIIARNSFDASFLDARTKSKYKKELSSFFY